MDILNFEMISFEQKGSFNTIQKEFEAALAASSQIDSERVLELFPELLSNKADILKRSPIRFSKTKASAETLYTEEQMYSFGDEALGQLYINIPPKLSSSVSKKTNSGILSCVIKEKMEIQINKLAESGYNRSAFQIIKKFDFHQHYFITVLQDSISPGKVTNLIVYLDRDHLHDLDLGRINFLEKISHLSTHEIITRKVSLFHLDRGDCTNVFDDRWVVYVMKGERDENGRSICHIKQSNCQSQDAGHWEVIGAYDTEKEAKAAVNSSTRCSNKM